MVYIWPETDKQARRTEKVKTGRNAQFSLSGAPRPLQPYVNRVPKIEFLKFRYKKFVLLACTSGFGWRPRFDLIGTP